MENIVEVRHLSHKYNTDWAIRDINLSIKSRGILGLLGSNGAGKSTTMNIICGVLNQTEGDVFINGINLRENPVEAKKRIGFLPQKPPLHMDLTVYEYLVHCAELRRMPRSKVKEAVEIAMERCAITHFRKRLIRHLSGGYQQRVGIAQAIVHNPEFVVLDEPTNGLDPNQIVEIRNLIRDIAKYHAVLLSTHILSEIQAICDEVKMIENGHLVFSGSMEDFDNYIAPESFIIDLGNAPSMDVLSSLSDNKGIEEIAKHRFRIFFDNDSNITEKYIDESVKNNWELNELIVERSSLDEVFAQLSGKTKK